MPQLSQFTAEFFKALAHPLRIRILDALRAGEVGVNELRGRLQIEQSTLSQQLAVLRKGNIVTGRKEGQNVFYSVSDPKAGSVVVGLRGLISSADVTFRCATNVGAHFRPGSTGSSRRQREGENAH